MTAEITPKLVPFRLNLEMQSVDDALAMIEILERNGIPIFEIPGSGRKVFPITLSSVSGPPKIDDPPPVVTGTFWFGMNLMLHESDVRDALAASESK